MTIIPLLAIVVGGCGAFQSPRVALYSTRHAPLGAVKFDKVGPLLPLLFFLFLLLCSRHSSKSSGRWTTDDPVTEGPEAGYNIVGSLYRYALP